MILVEIGCLEIPTQTNPTQKDCIPLRDLREDFLVHLRDDFGAFQKKNYMSWMPMEEYGGDQIDLRVQV